MATLLFLIHKQDAIETKPEIATLLNSLTESQLRQVLLHVAEEGSHFADVIEREVAWLKQETGGTAVANTTTTNLNSVRREIHKAFRQSSSVDSRYSYYDEYEALAIDSEAIVRPHLDEVGVLLDAGEFDTAVELIATIAESFIDGLTDLEEWVYEYNQAEIEEAIFSLDEVVAEIVLSRELSADEQKSWQKRIAEWERGLSALEIARTAVKQGWSYPPLVEAMAGNITEKGAWDGEAPDFADELAHARLRILARQGRTQEYINLATAEGFAGLATNMLAKSGNIAQAVADAKSYLTYPQQILSLAQLLAEEGELKAALDVAEHGLTLNEQPGLAELAQWMREKAIADSNQSLTIKAARAAFATTYALEDYLAAQEAAGNQWPEVKPALLKRFTNNRRGFMSGTLTWTAC